MRSLLSLVLSPLPRLFLVLALALGGVAGAQEAPAEDEAAVEMPPPPPPCGTQPLTLARMQWPTASLLTEIHAQILAARYGCKVEVQEADMATTGSTMGATGQPAVAPELWVSRIADIWNAAIQAQEVRQGGTSYVEGVFEGWFVPAYALEAFPQIASIEGLKAQAAAMGQGGERPKFISCPLDWGCNIVNRNLLRATGLDQLFQVIEPANRFELDTLIAEAVGRQEAFVFYYWQPNAILAQFAFREVQLGAYNKENFQCLGRIVCANPQPSGFAPDPVIIAVSEWVYTEAPEVALYFQRAKLPLAEMNAMLQQLSDTGATTQSVAARFIAERGAVWKPWAGLEVEAEERAQPRPQGVEAAPPLQPQTPEPPPATSGSPAPPRQEPQQQQQRPSAPPPREAPAPVEVEEPASSLI